MGLLEGKILANDTVSQNRLKYHKKISKKITVLFVGTLSNKLIEHNYHN